VVNIRLTFYSYNFFPDCGLNDQTITLSSISTQTTQTNSFNFNGTSTSGLPLQYYVISGQANIIADNCNLLGIPGNVVIRAMQHGNNVYNPANFIEQSFEVVKQRIAQEISFQTIGPVLIEPSAGITLEAISSLARPVKFVCISGPAQITENVLNVTGEAGYVTIRAYNEGDYTTEAAYQEQIIYICLNNLVLNNPSNNVYSNETKLFDANMSITTSAVLESGSKVIYDANNFILLNPGFTVKSGAIFETNQNGCRNQ